MANTRRATNSRSGRWPARRAAGGVTEPSSGAGQSRAAVHRNARPSNNPQRAAPGRDRPGPLGQQEGRSDHESGDLHEGWPPRWAGTPSAGNWRPCRPAVTAEREELPAEFVDDGCSGLRLDRPGLAALRDAARAGAIEVSVRFHDAALDGPQARHLAQLWAMI